MEIKQEIPIFFSCDDNYVPYLTVAIQSMKENSSKDNLYKIIILTSCMNDSHKKEIKLLESENVKIEFQDIGKLLGKIDRQLKLRLRDYYSISIFYRLFIPNLFKKYDKAIYIDADTVVLDDIANLYNMPIEDDLLIAVPDMVINDSNTFHRYSEIALGIPYKQYINSGMIVMNLKEMRKEKIEQKFIYLLLKYNLEVCAPDQDYLNILCKNKIKYIGEEWNKMPDFGKRFKEEELHIIHYNMMRKPWHYEDVPYSDVFWRYAKKSAYYDYMKKELENFDEEKKEKDQVGIKNLWALADKIVAQDIKLADVVSEVDTISEDTSYYLQEFDNVGNAT